MTLISGLHKVCSQGRSNLSFPTTYSSIEMCITSKTAPQTVARVTAIKNYLHFKIMFSILLPHIKVLALKTLYHQIYYLYHKKKLA